MAKTKIPDISSDHPNKSKRKWILGGIAATLLIVAIVFGTTSNFFGALKSVTGSTTSTTSSKNTKTSSPATSSTTKTSLSVDCGSNFDNNGEDVYVGFEDSQLKFDASETSGDIATYAWNFGDGNTGSSSRTIDYNTYSDAGEYEATLTVTTNSGGTNTCTVPVIIGGNYDNQTDGSWPILSNYNYNDNDNYDHTLEAIFTLHDYSKLSSGRLSSLTEDSIYKAVADDISGVSVDVIISPEIGLFDFSGSDTYIRFNDESQFNPENWLVVHVTTEVDALNTGDQQAIIAKQTDQCGQPLYMLKIEDGKYEGVISVDDTKYSVTSGSCSVDGSLQLVVFVYTGSEIAMYVDWQKCGSQSVSGKISSSNATKPLVIGRDNVCADAGQDEKDFDGTISDIFIYGG